jgi:hypothetical protein
MGGARPGQSTKPGGEEYAPLWLYEGSWQLSPVPLPTGAKPDRIDNHCHLFGKYFACQQTINGVIGFLIVFVPDGKPGHYFVQSLTPEGRPTGRADLDIAGDHWTYSRQLDDSGKTVFHRTTNVFSGKDKIHYEQLESSDGVHWTVKSSGDEQRIR